MDRSKLLKEKVVRLVNQFGVTQKFLADRMELSPAMLSRWLSNERPEPRIPLKALDGFERYERELLKALGVTSETEQTAKRG